MTLSIVPHPFPFQENQSSNTDDFITANDIGVEREDEWIINKEETTYLNMYAYSDKKPHIFVRFD